MTYTYAERYLGGERVSVIDDWETVITVPTVHLDAPTPAQQHLPVHTDDTAQYNTITGGVFRIL